MARGKYASSAEARRAREEAIAESNKATRRADQAERALSEDRLKWAAERDALLAQVDEMKVRLEKGVTLELQRTQERLADLQTRYDAQANLLAHRVLDVLGHHGQGEIAGSQKFHEDMADALEIPFSEYVSSANGSNRSMRRMTKTAARRGLNAHAELDASGRSL